MRINLGCGPRPLPGFVNVDLLDLPGVDVHADVSKPLPFEGGSAELIYASHVLEHLPHIQVPTILADWRRVLCDGGRLLVAVPDLQTVAEVLRSREGWFTPPHNPWLGVVYGGQKDEYDFHKTGFTAVWLTYLLRNAGFGDIRRVARFAEIDAYDGSWSPLPFGINLSLNLEATAGTLFVGDRLFAPAWWQSGFEALDKVLTLAIRASAYSRSRLMRRRLKKLESLIDGRESPTTLSGKPSA